MHISLSSLFIQGNVGAICPFLFSASPDLLSLHTYVRQSEDAQPKTELCQSEQKQKSAQVRVVFRIFTKQAADTVFTSAFIAPEIGCNGSPAPELT